MPYHNLNVYRKSYGLAIDIHRLTLSFPKIEQWELAGQVRRSSKSIPVNLAEGMGKQESKRDVLKFVRIALGSCDETQVWLEFAKDLGYLSSGAFEDLSAQYNEVGRMLRGLIKRYSDSSSSF